MLPLCHSVSSRRFVNLIAAAFVFVAVCQNPCEGTTIEANTERDDLHVLFLMDHVIRIGIFSFLSAVFAGLTLGVMCSDTFTLEIIAESGPMPICTYAATILPLRKQGHKTLCTLIISNMLCNVLIVQEFNKIFSSSAAAASKNPNEVAQAHSFWNFATSTLFIVFFTELIPMSICRSKHSLRVAAAGSIIVRIAMLLTFPISAPLGKVLDLIVGETENGMIYDKNELRRLMVLHYERHEGSTDMPKTELKLLLAAMDFQECCVQDIMTPLKEVTMVKETEVITADFVERVWMSGRSRLPVVSAHGEVKHILMAKDLMGVRRFTESTTVLDIVQAKKRMFAQVGELTPLPAVLKFFQDAKMHMAVVLAENSESDASSTSKYRGRKEVGIITLEDVVEKMLNDQIYDEYDRYDYIEHREKMKGVDKLYDRTHLGLSKQHIDEPMKAPRVNFYSYFTHPELNTPLTHPQVWAVAYFLHRAVKAFALFSPSSIFRLLEECGDQQFSGKVKKRNNSYTSDIVEGELLQNSDNSTREFDQSLSAVSSHKSFGRVYDEELILFKRGTPSQQFLLVLGGRVDMLVGRDCFHSTMRSFDFIGEDALLSPFYYPDSTIFIQHPARVFLIKKSSYEKLRSELSRNTSSLSFPNSSVDLERRVEENLSLISADSSSRLPTKSYGTL